MTTSLEEWGHALAEPLTRLPTKRSAYEREVASLEKERDKGLITDQEFAAALREIDSERFVRAFDAYEQALDEELGYRGGSW